MLIRPKTWERHGLKPWIEAAKKRLHHNVLAIALANKLARTPKADFETAFATFVDPRVDALGLKPINHRSP